MRWVAKALAQKALSLHPQGTEFNYALQRRVLHNLPQGEEGFGRKVREAVVHFSTFRRLMPEVASGDARVYEFGAGWDLVIPLAYYAMGFDQQTLIDVRSNARVDLVNDTLRRLREHRATFDAALGRPSREIDPTPLRSLEELTARFGITYKAPADARATGLPTSSLDFVSTSGVLGNIPAADLREVCGETYRLLRPGGVFSCAIDVADHYANFDPSISQYHFLKFPDRVWWLFNSPLHYQNRLRARDYSELMRDVGFDVASEERVQPGPHAEEELLRLPVAEQFARRYPLEELVSTSLDLAVIKR